jgi:hypothetical protein
LDEAQGKAKEYIKGIGAAGMSLDRLKEKAPDQLAALLKSSGMDEFSLNLALNAARKPAEKIDWKTDVKGSYLISYGTDPVTGKVVYQTKELPKDAVGKDIRIVDGEIWAVDADGESAKKIGGPGKKAEDAAGFTLGPGQIRYGANGEVIAKGPDKDPTQTGLDYRTQSQVDALSKGFDTSPIVKSYVEVQNKKQSVQQILQNGASGPADVALVYEFMKSLDPTSVVRESEYANAAKSGNLFLGILSRFNGYFKEEGGTLPENVKTEFSKILNTKYDVVKKQYENLYDETSRKINLKTGSRDGSQYLTQYDFDMAKEEAGIAEDELQELRQAFPGLSDEELMKGAQGFNQESQTSLNGTVSIPASSRLAYVNNNPGNLRFVGQRGATQGEGGFARFDSPEAGYEALKDQIRLDASRGMTLAGFIRKYAPPNENDTSLYLRQVAMATGSNPGDALRGIDLDDLARAMARKESSTKIA